MRKIQIVSRMEEGKLKKMLNQYLLELSEFDPTVEFDKKGIPKYRWLKNYFLDKDRFPIYLMIENKVVGFALIRELGSKSFEIAEFYVLPKFRDSGNAMWFAKSITDLFGGEFCFSARVENKRAIRFWDKFVLDFKTQSVEIKNCYKIWKIK